MADPKVPTAKLITLFEEERDALSSGDRDRLQTLARTKEHLVQQVAEAGVEGHELAMLRAEATRNEALLAAHAAGLRAAIKRIEALSAPGDPFTSYDKSGALKSIGSTAPGFERRS